MPRGMRNRVSGTKRNLPECGTERKVFPARALETPRQGPSANRRDRGTLMMSRKGESQRSVRKESASEVDVQRREVGRKKRKKRRR